MLIFTTKRQRSSFPNVKKNSRNKRRVHVTRQHSRGSAKVDFPLKLKYEVRTTEKCSISLSSFWTYSTFPLYFSCYVLCPLFHWTLNMLVLCVNS